MSITGRRLQRSAQKITSVPSMPDPIGQSPGAWQPLFNEEFNASSVTILDQNQGMVQFGSGPIWQAWYPNALVGDGNAHTNNPGTEIEYYDTTALSVAQNQLVITATHDNVHAGFAYTSGLLQSNPTFNPQFGYAEARIKSPGLAGSWPAFWMIPASYTWPPEIDIYENFGSAGNYQISNFGSGATVHGDSVTTNVTQWHVYGLKWDAGVLEWYLDGVLVGQEQTPSSVPNEPMYLVVNLAVNNTTFSTYQLNVDYVRFWQKI